MPKVETRAPSNEVGADLVKAPSVLVILVTRDGDAWLPQCLLALSKQTHPRMGVLAVDNGSSDGSTGLLESALGAGRVIKLETNAGFGGALAEALRTEVAKQADYVLFLHDDVLLAPDAVSSMVETAERVGGAGVVGPKVLDWEDPRILRGIGLSTDRFGYPYSPLEEGEIDQGQYDRVRQVRFVSSCAMLVSRSVWTRIGPPDPRFSHSSEDLDFCWRAQLAGFHVLMTPKAVAHHRGATEHGERPGARDRPYGRYHHERVALASIIKNYSALSLLWVMPLYFIQGAARIFLLILSRRFEDASQVMAAWGWNLTHLPGTLRLRVRAQAIRAVPDRSVRRSMAPTAIRLRQWAASAAGTILPSRHRDEFEPAWGGGFVRFAVSHPVALAWTLGTLLVLVAYRNLLFATALGGGGLSVFPDGPGRFFGEFVSGIRSTGLGGSQAASPAVALLGVGSVLTLGNPALLQKLLLLILPLAGTVGCYRAVRSITKERISAVVAASCYGLSSVALWSFSDGRLPVLVLLAGIPWAAGKLSLAFEAGPRRSPIRWIVGAGLGVAILASFYPAAALAEALIVAGALGTAPGSRARLRGLVRVAAATLLASVLALPVLVALVRAGGQALHDPAGPSSLAQALRLSPGPGGWVTAFYLPVAAALALLFVEGPLFRPALRASLTGLAGVYLGWAAGGGHLPAALSNAPAYLSVAAFEFALLVGLGLAALFPGVARASFGRRQVGGGALAIALAVGLGGGAAQAARGSWLVGEGGVPAAYAAVNQTASPFRVLWVGRLSGRPFSAPGGLAERTVFAGPASVRFAVTGPSGASALDFGRPAAGPGYDALEAALSDILAGETQHGGALLAPFGIRYVVATPTDLPRAAARRLKRQLDLDLLPTAEMIILRNDKAALPASVVQSPEWLRASREGGLPVRTALTAPTAQPLAGSGERYSGLPGPRPALVFLSQQFDARWKVQPGGGGTGSPPSKAFGWAVGFGAPTDASGFAVRFGGQGTRTAEVALLAVLWLAALWATRRPVRGR